MIGGGAAGVGFRAFWLWGVGGLWVGLWPPCLLRPRVPSLVVRLCGPRANPNPRQTNEIRAGRRMADGWGHPRVRRVAAVLAVTTEINIM